MPPLPEQDTKLGLEEEEEDISFSLHANLVCTSFGSLCGTEYRFLSIAISPGFALVSASLISPFYPNHYYFVNFLSCYTRHSGLWKRLRNRLVYHS